MTAVSIGDKLATRPPRERGGSIGSNRYDFQKDWTICKILELHKQQQSYLILCDYHEDVVVLDDEVNPTAAEFFQVKTKPIGNWTIKNLGSS
jgi:hypothetical protein